MSPEAIALLNFATRFGLDAAITIAERLNQHSTLEEVLAALKAAKEKTADQYLSDAAARLTATPSSPAGP